MRLGESYERNLSTRFREPAYCDGLLLVKKQRVAGAVAPVAEHPPEEQREVVLHGVVTLEKQPLNMLGNLV